MLPIAEAVKIVKEQTSLLPSEQVEIHSALGRVLAEEIVADSDLPPFDRSQMDGYALRASDIETASSASPVKLKIAGESAAGSGWHNELKSGEAVRIMTGAPVPPGADSVQQVELTRESDDRKVVEILEAVAPGRSIVRRAAEIKSGETVLRAGERINAAMVAVLAAFGYAKVRAGKQPRVSVLATGTELVAVHEKPGRDQIRDSNNYSIASYAELAGAKVERLPLTVDDTNSLKATIQSAAERSDVIITSGGVSMGVYDFTKTALREMDAEIFFERVALKPGKPTVFARLPNGTLFFGLPGNPVSVSVTFNLFARTALLRLQGAGETEMRQQTARLVKPLKVSVDRDSYLPAILSSSPDGALMAEPLKWGGSSDFVAFARATALVIAPAGVKNLEPGAVVNVAILP